MRSAFRPDDPSPSATAAPSADSTPSTPAEHRAGEMEKHLELALRASGMGAWHWDLRTRALIWDDVMFQLLGLSPNERIDTFEMALSRVHADDREALRERVQRSIATGEEYNHEFRVEWPDGTVHALVGRGAVYHDDDGRPARMLGVCWDVTAARAAQEALRTSEARYRGLVESQQDLIFRCNLEERVTFANDAYCARFGLPREEVVGGTFTNLHPDDRAATMATIAALMQPPYRAMLETRIATPDGWRWVSWSACAIKDHAGRIVEIQCAGRDVTERYVVEQELRASLTDLQVSERRLRDLAQRLAAVREDERRRLGLDLHDGVCQDLAGIGMLVGSLRQRLGPLDADTDVMVGRAERYLQAVGDHLRNLAHELRPMLLDDVGLEGGLRALAQGFASATLRVDVRFASPITRLPAAIEEAVYRIAQEACANAVRHAAASTITLTLEVTDTVHMEVRDDGIGFDSADRNRGHTLGLASIAERALAVGGTLTIESSPGMGTTIRFACPIADARTYVARRA